MSAMDTIFWWVGCAFFYLGSFAGLVLLVWGLNKFTQWMVSRALYSFRGWRHYGAYHKAGCAAMLNSIRAEAAERRRKEEANERDLLG